MDPVIRFFRLQLLSLMDKYQDEGKCTEEQLEKININELAIDLRDDDNLWDYIDLAVKNRLDKKLKAIKKEEKKC